MEDIDFFFGIIKEYFRCNGSIDGFDEFSRKEPCGCFLTMMLLANVEKTIKDHYDGKIDNDRMLKSMTAVEEKLSEIRNTKEIEIIEMDSTEIIKWLNTLPKISGEYEYFIQFLMHLVRHVIEKSNRHQNQGDILPVSMSTRDIVDNEI